MGCNVLFFEEAAVVPRREDALASHMGQVNNTAGAVVVADPDAIAGARLNLKRPDHPRPGFARSALLIRSWRRRPGA